MTDESPRNYLIDYQQKFRLVTKISTLLVSASTVKTQSNAAESIGVNDNSYPAMCYSTIPSNMNNNKSPTQIVVRLEYIDNVYCMKYVIYNDNYRYNVMESDKGTAATSSRYTIYRAIVDTGSPFLIVPSICTYMWGKGCLNNYKSVGFDDSTINYGGQEYNTAWRTGNFSFIYQPQISPLYSLFDRFFGMDEGALTSLTLSSFQKKSFKQMQKKYQLTEPQYPLVFGVTGAEIMLPPGGCFLGMS
jgi:hypothetical protein